MNRIMTVILTVSFVLPIPTSILATQQSVDASHIPPSRGTPGRTISGGTR
jgi:hypothetical protein